MTARNDTLESVTRSFKETMAELAILTATDLQVKFIIASPGSMKTKTLDSKLYLLLAPYYDRWTQN